MLLIIPGFSSTALALTRGGQGFTLHGFYVFTKLWENDHDTSNNIAPLQLGVRYHKQGQGEKPDFYMEFSTEHQQHFMRLRRGCRHLNTAFEGIKNEKENVEQAWITSQYTIRTLSALLVFIGMQRNGFYKIVVYGLLRDAEHYGG